MQSNCKVCVTVLIINGWLTIFVMNDSKETRRFIMFSRSLRWALGILFISIGLVYYNEGTWPAILFGTVFFITGFFRPKRCLEEGCQIESAGEKGLKGT